MSNWNTGSVSDQIWAIMPDKITTEVSGTAMTNIINQRIIYAGNIAGTTIDPNNIEPKFQGPVTELSMAKLLLSNSAGADSNANEVSLGEFKIKKGAGTNSDTNLAQSYEKNALRDLRRLNSGRSGYSKAWGV